jgi:hypothetical protein
MKITTMMCLEVPDLLHSGLARLNEETEISGLGPPNYRVYTMIYYLHIIYIPPYMWD